MILRDVQDYIRVTLFDSPFGRRKGRKIAGRVIYFVAILEYEYARPMVPYKYFSKALLSLIYFH